MIKKTDFAEVWQKSDGSPIPLVKVRVLLYFKMGSRAIMSLKTHLLV